MKDVFLEPLTKLEESLGINKVASQQVAGRSASDMSNKQLARELGKLAGDMPEDMAGQKMHDDKTTMDIPDKTPATHVLENTMENKYRRDTKHDDNLDTIDQTPVPGGRPEDLDTNQDPLARVAEKIAAAIEPYLNDADINLEKSAGLLSRRIDNMSAPIVGMRKEAAVNWKGVRNTALTALGGTAIGAGLGIPLGMKAQRGKSDKEKENIFRLGAQVGGQLAANNILEQLSAFSDYGDKGGE